VLTSSQCHRSRLYRQSPLRAAHSKNQLPDKDDLDLGASEPAVAVVVAATTRVAVGTGVSRPVVFRRRKGARLLGIAMSALPVGLHLHPNVVEDTPKAGAAVALGSCRREYRIEGFSFATPGTVSGLWLARVYYVLPKYDLAHLLDRDTGQCCRLFAETVGCFVAH
jgi:hypothetical protein